MSTLENAVSASPYPWAKKRALATAAVIATLSGLIVLGGHTLGHAISLGGYTDARTAYDVTIGADTLHVPANMIRHAPARRSGQATRLDLYLRWPGMDGFSEPARDDFNNKDGARRILFLSFEPRLMSRDMSGRLDPVYGSLILKPGAPGPGGTTAYGFRPDSGYVDETLFVGDATPAGAFVARCLTGETADELVAPCERDIAVGNSLSLTYRFPRALLAQWPAMEASVRRAAAALLAKPG